MLSLFHETEKCTQGSSPHYYRKISPQRHFYNVTKELRGQSQIDFRLEKRQLTFLKLTHPPIPQNVKHLKSLKIDEKLICFWFVLIHFQVLPFLYWNSQIFSGGLCLENTVRTNFLPLIMVVKCFDSMCQSTKTLRHEYHEYTCTKNDKHSCRKGSNYFTLFEPLCNLISFIQKVEKNKI